MDDFLAELESIVRQDAHTTSDSCIEVLYSNTTPTEGFLDDQNVVAWAE